MTVAISECLWEILLLILPGNVQRDRGPRVLEDVLRVGVGQLGRVEVVDADDAVAHVEDAFAGGADRNLKKKPRF